MEKKITKYFWIINLATLALVAYFLASGTNELAAGTIAELLPAPKSTTNNVQSSRTTLSNRTLIQNGDIIIDRNIFDSTATVIPETDDIDPDAEPLTDGEMRLVQCSISGVKLLASVASDRDPEWSFANVEVNGQKQLYRIGDEISGRTVSGISWRYLMLRGTSDECYIDMFDQDPNAPKRTVAAAPKPEEDTAAKGISVDGEFERTVDRSVVDQALANPTKFAKDVRVRPYKKNGEVVGFRLRRVQPGSAIEKLGAKRGDVLHSVNGVELKSVDDALSAYQKLRSENQLIFSVTRRGKPVDLKINID